jgi:hypothetical protein
MERAWCSSWQVRCCEQRSDAKQGSHSGALIVKVKPAPPCGGVVAQGAEQMGQMEHLLNVYATKSAKGAIADFVGYVEVRESEATMRLTQGLWLVRRSGGSVIIVIKALQESKEILVIARRPCAVSQLCAQPTAERGTDVAD